MSYLIKDTTREEREKIVSDNSFLHYAGQSDREQENAEF